MDFNFQHIERGAVNLESLPDDIVSVGQKTMSISRNIANAYEARVNVGSDKYDRVRLAFGYDPSARALRVTEDPEGFSSRIRKDRMQAALVNIPTNLNKAGLVAGTYKLVPGSTNIFQYVG
jgi:hypothetical protein